MKKIVPLILVAAILLALPLHFASAAIIRPKDQNPTRTYEAIELRQCNSDTYCLSDGTYECVIYAYDSIT